MIKKRKKGEAPTFIPDVTKLTDSQLCEVYNDSISYFYEALEGGTQFGVDWPTVRIMFPDVCEKLTGIHKECIARLEKNNGVLNGVQYEKKNKRWKPKGE